MKVMNDHRSKFSNLSSWKEKPERNQGSNGIRTHDLRDTGAMLYQLSYEATHRYRGGHGFESRWSPDFFQASLSNCLSWKIYCDDHSLHFLMLRGLFLSYFAHARGGESLVTRSREGPPLPLLQSTRGPDFRYAWRSQSFTDLSFSYI